MEPTIIYSRRRFVTPKRDPVIVCGMRVSVGNRMVYLFLPSRVSLRFITALRCMTYTPYPIIDTIASLKRELRMLPDETFETETVNKLKNAKTNMPIDIEGHIIIPTAKLIKMI